MPRTREELEEAAARAERLLDELDPRVLLDSATRVDDLREVGVALTEVAAAERHLFEAVKAARANHRSWGEIASVLGISKQGARDRFAPEPSRQSNGGPLKTRPTRRGLRRAVDVSLKRRARAEAGPLTPG